MMQAFLQDYSTTLMSELNKLDPDAIQQTIDILIAAHRDRKKIFVAGNGGSAGTANHFVCDFGKNAVKDDENRFRIISVSDNVEKITALGNDISFDSIFSEQLKNLMDPGEVLIVITASGNSPDILKAVELAKKKDCTVIGITGFQGGKVRSMVDVNINVALDSYEQVEDAHLIILHMIVCWFKENQEALTPVAG